MPIMRLGNDQVDVNIEEELSKYEWGREKWTSNRLIASSPFRNDKSPSFFVDLESGGWGDSGAGLGENSSGNFVTLIALLNDIEYHEAIQYLKEEHKVMYDLADEEEIFFEAPKLTTKEENVIIDVGHRMTESFSNRLSKRGIGEEVQKMFRIGYGNEVEYHTAMPWITYEGVTANIKYRSTVGKTFFYEKSGTSIHKMVYGVHLHERIEGSVVIVEGEIDAMSFWQAGISAVALGHSSINDVQSGLIKNLNVQEIILGGDNDWQGRLLNKEIRTKLGNAYSYSEIDYGKQNDANDVLTSEGERGIIEKYESRKRIDPFELRIK